jgi:hypothetical protein
MARPGNDSVSGESDPRGDAAEVRADRRAQIDKIVKLTHVMRARVEVGAWEDIVAMETERQELLNAFFAVEPTQAEAGWIADSIQEMLRINAEMEETCRKHLQEISTSIGRTAPDAD